MLTQEYRQKFDAYSFYNGMRNIAWVAGYARNIVKDDTGFIRSFCVQQTNNVNHMIPVEFVKGYRPPKNFRETSRVKVIGHISGRKLENGERIAVFRAISVEQPTLLDLPALSAWEKELPEGAPLDNFKPSEPGLAPYMSANMVKLAGFVEASFLAKNNGKVQHDCLIVLLRQSPDADKSVPVRVYGSMAQMYHSRVQAGIPVLISGFYRIHTKVVEKGENGSTDTVKNNPYVHVQHLRVCSRDDIKVQPKWAIERLEQIKAARSAGARPGKAEHEEDRESVAAPAVAADFAPDVEEQDLAEVIQIDASRPPAVTSEDIKKDLGLS